MFTLKVHQFWNTCLHVDFLLMLLFGWTSVLVSALSLWNKYLNHHQ